MQIQQKEISSKGIKFFVNNEDGKEVGRGYLFLLTNELHDTPFGFIEDVYVDESCRGQGIGSSIVKEMIIKAKEIGCYKLIITARYSKPKVRELYQRLGFRDWSTSFRMDF
jgi:GNAT superfamily N-acetyltransferase